MGKLIMLVGLPASGKSTYAKEFARLHADAFVFSSDDYRERLLYDVNDQSQNELVFKTLYAEARKCLEQDCTAIIDATNITRKSRKRCLDNFKDMNIIRECHIIPTFFDLCIDRDAGRDRTVGTEVIMKFAKCFEVPMYFEGFDLITIPAGMDFQYQVTNHFAVSDQMIYFDQKNKHHSFKLADHCSNVVEALFEAGIEVSKDRALLTAAVWHDVGKLYTQTIDEEGQGHYYCHANISALWLLGCKEVGLGTFDIDELLEAAFYAGEHMHIRDIIKSEKAIKKYKELFGEKRYNNLVTLMHCDNFGSKHNVTVLKEKYEKLRVTDIDVATGEDGTKAIYFHWSCDDVGFGEFTVYIKDGKFQADTEYMDSPVLKLFTKALMNNFVDNLEVD